MRLFAGQLMMCVVVGLTLAWAEQVAPDLTDAEILQVAKHVRAGRALQEEQQRVVAIVNQMPEVKQLAAHQKDYQAEEDRIKAEVLKAHSLDPAKWDLDFRGERFVPVQVAQSPPAPAKK